MYKRLLVASAAFALLAGCSDIGTTAVAPVALTARLATMKATRRVSTWPWVVANQYVFVQGRHYYDGSSSQGTDWTEDDTSGSWDHVGYVAVCSDSGTSCQKYW